MSEKKEVEDLFKNLHQGLKKVGVKELNNGILRIIGEKNNKSDDIYYVLTIVCKEFDITLNNLKTKYPKGIVQDAKQIAYCLLYFDLHLTIRYIANKVFQNWPTSVYTGIKRFKQGDPNHKADKNFLEKYNKLKLQTKEFLNK